MCDEFVACLEHLVKLVLSDGLRASEEEVVCARQSESLSGDSPADDDERWSRFPRLKFRKGFVVCFGFGFRACEVRATSEICFSISFLVPGLTCVFYFMYNKQIQEASQPTSSHF